MGSFSWLRAEMTIKRANITDGDKYKILIPKFLGGGYIADTYEDYGDINSFNNAVYVDAEGNKTSLKGFGTADLYGLLFYFNEPDSDLLPIKAKNVLDILKNGKTSHQDIRHEGIEMGCYDKDVDKLKYPLKLVSMSYKESYENCPGKSYSDPNQGFGAFEWGHYPNYVKKLTKLYDEYEELKSKSLDDLLESGKSLHEISIIYKNNEER